MSTLCGNLRIFSLGLCRLFVILYIPLTKHNITSEDFCRRIGRILANQIATCFGTGSLIMDFARLVAMILLTSERPRGNLEVLLHEKW